MDCFLESDPIFFPGAHGYFEVTNDITQYCKADMFSKVGKQTPMFIRFSTVGKSVYSGHLSLSDKTIP